MSRCHSTLHAATRRELLLASGTLFAWAYLPKVARADGPRIGALAFDGWDTHAAVPADSAK